MNTRSVLKSVAASFILIGIALGAASCTKKASFNEKSDVTLSDFDDHKVEMTVNVVKNRKLNVTFENKSDRTYMYGRIYSLEIDQNGVWYKVPFKDGYGVFTDEGIIVGPAEEYAVNNTDSMSISPVSTEPVYLEGMGVLPEGHYRIVKKISVMNGGKDYVLAAEFDLDKYSDKPGKLEKSQIPEDKIVSESDYALPIIKVNKNSDIEITFNFSKYSTTGQFYLQYKKDGNWYDVPIRGTGGVSSSIPSDDVLILNMEEKLKPGSYRLLHDRNSEGINASSYYSYTFELS